MNIKNIQSSCCALSNRITGFSFLTPQYLIRDTDMIRKIFVKDFEFFEDHTQFFKTDNEPLLANTLISLTGEKWRAMRSTLSPAFTGSKMRQMFELVTEYTDETAKFLLAKSHNEKLNFEMKDFFSRYANDIIATCAFGLKVSSFIEPDNDFYVNARKLASNRSFSQTLKFLLLITAPKIAKALKIPVFDREYTAKFRSMILDTMHVRKMQNIHRPDMIHLLMQVRDGTLNHTIAEEAKTEGFATVEESDIGKQHSNRNWTDDELVAQCLLFFFAGLETVSTALTFAAYEIMVNQDVQQKLYDEISDTNERLGDKRISYDELQKMKYLDQVVCEVLRKWPPALQTERICVKDYQYDDGDKKFIIEKGKTVFIPTYGLHHDERHYPEPETFNPDRFSDENRSNINSSAYLPFGVGPRNCIGKRARRFIELDEILHFCKYFRLTICIDGSEGDPLLFAVELYATTKREDSRSNRDRADAAVWC